jgi:pyruvyltransferase
MIKAFWWNKKVNFGDRLNSDILRFLGVEHAWAPVDQAELVMIGSVLEHLPPDWAGTVCGAGKLHEGSMVDLTHANVLALRGHLSANSVLGLARPVVLGDPALLMPQWVKQGLIKWDLGVIPHWSDKELRARFPYGQFIDPSWPPEKVVTQIALCKRIISSSLHGLIIADAYGIPRQAEIFPQAAKEGGDFKFRDYASIYDTHPHFGEMWRAPFHIVERTRNELREALRIALGQVQEHAPVPDPHVQIWSKTLHPQISILVPFRDDGEQRSIVWNWLRQYWYANLESVEIVQGHDDGWPFSKAVAVNNAAARAHGRVFVILDADTYLDTQVVQNCADAIERAQGAGKRLWFMPYNKLYRLDQPATARLLGADPTCPYDIPTPPPPDWLETGIGGGHGLYYGHQFGALIQIMPREAFALVGGMDPRFRGWGSEDASLLRALDTLYCQHELARRDVLHLWHPHPGTDWTTRRWVGQQIQTNSRLAQRYSMATGEPYFMRSLVDEHVQPL